MGCRAWLAGCLKRGIIGILLVAFSSGCTPKSVRLLLEAPPTDIPGRSLMSDVPFTGQTDNFCGPAAVSMVLEYYGQKVNLAELGQAVYVPGLKGSLQVEMTALIRRRGLLAYPLPNSLDSLLHELAAGNPVIVLQNLGLKIAPQWHYAVAIGYDLPNKKIILHSGTTSDYRLALKTFAYTWARGDNWALVPLPVGALPQHDDPNGVFLAGSDLVNMPKQKHQAKLVYASMVKRWPAHEASVIALANEHYAERNFALAASVLRSALHHSPKSAAIYNNLAYSLVEQGCIEMAREAVLCAVKYSSSHEFKESLTEIEMLPPSAAAASICPSVHCADSLH